MTFIHLVIALLQIDCFDYDGDGSHDFIGSFSTTGTQLKSGGGGQVGSLF